MIFVEINEVSVISDSQAIGDLSSESIVTSLETGSRKAIPHSDTFKTARLEKSTSLRLIKMIVADQ